MIRSGWLPTAARNPGPSVPSGRERLRRHVAPSGQVPTMSRPASVCRRGSCPASPRCRSRRAPSFLPVRLSAVERLHVPCGLDPPRRLHRTTVAPVGERPADGLPATTHVRSRTFRPRNGKALVRGVRRPGGGPPTRLRGGGARSRGGWVIYRGPGWRPSHCAVTSAVCSPGRGAGSAVWRSRPRTPWRAYGKIPPRRFPGFRPEVRAAS